MPEKHEHFPSYFQFHSSVHPVILGRRIPSLKMQIAKMGLFRHLLCVGQNVAQIQPNAVAEEGNLYMKVAHSMHVFVKKSYTIILMEFLIVLQEMVNAWNAAYQHRDQDVHQKDVKPDEGGDMAVQEI